MKCPVCQHPEHRVIRTQEAADAIVRRRQCTQCRATWLTRELPATRADRIEKIERLIAETT